MTSQTTLPGFQHLLAVVKALRDPQTGCPWDLKQTHHSLRPFVLEEAYEVVDAIDSGEAAALKEELGDLLLQVVLHAQLSTDSGGFTADDVAQEIADKLIRRHPHVFGDVEVHSAEEVTSNWQKIKAQEKGLSQNSVMEGLKADGPALSHALKVSKKAVGVGFEWPDFESLWACVLSEHDEFRHERDQNAPFERLEDELGDILFATVNLARYHQIDPEIALHKATQKFIKRFQTMERLSEKPLQDQSFETLDALWTQAKQTLQASL